MKRIDLDKELLYDIYIVQNRSLEYCAEYFNVSVTCVRANLDRYEIKKSWHDICTATNRTVREATGEKKQKYFDAHSKRSKQARAKIKEDPDKQRQWSEKQSIAHKETWANKTDEEMEDFSAKLKARAALRTSEEWELKFERELETKRRNGTLGKSKPEDAYAQYLEEVFGADNVIRNHLDKRYCNPKTSRRFRCDFYIPSEDLFIELNAHWTHGGHPFDKTNKDDLMLLNTWRTKGKTSKYYRQACYVWTTLDPMKRQVAKDKGLNFIEVY